MAGICSICGSTHKVSKFKGGDLYCMKHYLQMRNYGAIYEYGKSRWTNSVELCGNYSKIITAKGEEILVDNEDLPLLVKYSWCLCKTGYAVASISKRTTKMHRLILNCNSEQVVDHINGNPLDNRKRNLRACTPKNNSRNKGMGRNNSTGVIGVSAAPNGKWRARIMVDKKEKSLGHFNSFEEAVNARRKAEAKYFGEFVRAAQ